MNNIIVKGIYKKLENKQRREFKRRIATWRE